MPDVGTQLESLVKRRDRLREQKQRIQGRLDSARSELATIEEECVRRKVDPEKIDAVISQLEQKLADEISSLERRMAEAEAQVAPFLEEDRK
jgi:predicted  nucleic acid-binding Zn-ribbon protein